MKELAIHSASDGQLLLFEGTRLLSQRRSTTLTLRWLPRRVIRWRHEWAIGDEATCLEVVFESNWTLSLRFAEFRIQSSQFTSGVLSGLNLLDEASFREYLSTHNLTFRLEGAREQFVDQHGELVLERVPVWKDDETKQGVVDKYLVAPTLDLKQVPAMIEVCRFHSMEFWKGYRLV